MNRLRYVAQWKTLSKQRSKVNLHFTNSKSIYKRLWLVVESNWYLRLSRQIPVNRLPQPEKILKRFRSYRPAKQVRKVRQVGDLLISNMRFYLSPVKSFAFKVALKNVSAQSLVFFKFVLGCTSVSWPLMTLWSSGVLASLSHWRSRVRIPLGSLHNELLIFPFVSFPFNVVLRADLNQPSILRSEAVVASRPHKPKVGGSNPSSATLRHIQQLFLQEIIQLNRQSICLVNKV